MVEEMNDHPELIEKMISRKKKLKRQIEEAEREIQEFMEQAKKIKKS